MTDFWTDDKVETLRGMAADGAFASDIAAAIGCTRSAVLGKATREGFKLQGGKNRLSPAVAVARIVRELPGNAPAGSDNPDNERRGVTLDQRAENGCTWVLPNGRYCGDRRQAATTKSWCPHHHRIGTTRREDQ